MLVLNTVDMLSQGVKTSVPLHLWKVSCCQCFITNPKKNCPTIHIMTQITGLVPKGWEQLSCTACKICISTCS